MSNGEMSHTPPDPFDEAPDEHVGAQALRRGRELVVAGHHEMALERCEAARRAGVPAALVPHLHLLTGLSLLHLGRLDSASVVLRDGWRDHPDFAALPLALGVALYELGERDAACRTMFAAAVEADPDASRLLYRQPLAALIGRFRT